jgi:hypothetical protein
MTATSGKIAEPTQQDVCIDLPGETVQCWRSSDNIRVVLRKHRDVIFDLNLDYGRRYTVEATEADFYNARDKKLVSVKRRDVVTFSDGERLHLWVTRDFRGALVVKSNGETLVKLTPGEIDSSVYDGVPATKPAPIIIARGPSSKKSSAPVTSAPRFSRESSVCIPPPSAAPITDSCSVVCVVDGSMLGIPSAIGAHFRKSGLADIDPFEVATRNWIWGQGAGAAAYVKDNWAWLRASLDSKTHVGFKLVSAKAHMVRGKVRFYFSGYSQYNTIFGRGGFGPGHDLIVNIFAGAGKTSSSFAAVAKGVAGTFKGNAFVSLIFGAATSIAEWKDDIKKDNYDLAAALVMGVLKAIISATLAVAIVALIMLLVAGSGLAIPVVAVGALTVFVSFGANYLVEVIDKKIGSAVVGDKNSTDGLSEVIAPAFRSAAAIFSENWSILMNKFPTDYQEVRFEKLGS